MTIYLHCQNLQQIYQQYTQDECHGDLYENHHYQNHPCQKTKNTQNQNKAISSSVANDLYHREIIRSYRQRLLSEVSPNFSIVKNAYGKPLSLHDPQLSFNHSHSPLHYALAYSTDVTDLGIDIEDLNRKVNMQGLARRFFHSQEWQAWQQTDFDPVFWFKVWTIKEAILKAHGMGIRLQLSSLNTQAHPTWDFGVITHPLLGQFNYQCLRRAHFMLTVAYRHQTINPDLQTLQHF